MDRNAGLDTVLLRHAGAGVSKIHRRRTEDHGIHPLACEAVSVAVKQATALAESQGRTEITHEVED